MNKFKEKTEEQNNGSTNPPKTQGRFTRVFVTIFSGSFLSRDKTLRQLPFILFLTVIALGYIANGYYSEKTVRQISQVNNDLKELKSEYIITMSDLMLLSKQSEVAKAAESLGIRESLVPPKKILVKNYKMVQAKND